MHNLQNRLTSCRGAFGGREDSNGLLSGPCILLTMDIDSESRQEERKTTRVSACFHKELSATNCKPQDLWGNQGRPT